MNDLKEERINEERGSAPAAPGGPGGPSGPGGGGAPINNDDPNDQMFSKRNVKNYFGSAITNMGVGSTNFINSYMMFFFTEFMGVGAVLISTILSIGTIVDGISDFIAGIVTDRFHTKTGKARHWIIWMGIPTGLSMALVFMCPENASNLVKFIYLLIIYNLFNTCLTFVKLPSMAMMPLGSDNQQARTAFWFVHNMAQSIGGMVFSALCVFFAYFFGGLNNLGITGYRGVAWCFCVFCGVTMVVGGLLFDEKHKGDEIEAEQAARLEKINKKQISTFKMVKYLILNKYWILFQLNNVANAVAMGFMMGVGTYYAKYCLGDLNKMAVLMGISSVPMLIGGFALAPFMKRFDARILSLVGIIGATIGAGIMWYAGHDAAAVNFGLLTAAYCIKAAFNSFTNGAYGSMMGRVIDYGEWKFGTRLDGLSFAGQSVLQKIMNAIATIVVGLSLAASGYSGGGDVADGAVNAISFMYLGIPFIATAVGIVVILLFNLPTSKVNEMRAEIEARKARGEYID